MPTVQDIIESKALEFDTPEKSVDVSSFGIKPVEPEVQTQDVVQQPVPVSVPQPIQATQPSSFVASLDPAIQQSQTGLQKAVEALTAQQTAEQEQRQDVLNRLLNMGTEPTANLFESKLEEQISKVTGQRPEDFLQTLTDANTTLAQLQGKFRTAGQAISGAQGQSKVFEGAQLNELSRQEAVEVGNQALIVQALQGNYDTARQIAFDTAKFAADDKLTELNNLIAQFNSVSQVASPADQVQLEAGLQELELEKAEIERTQDLIDEAILTGLAGVDEMQYLTSTEVPNEEKQRIAAQIISRGATPSSGGGFTAGGVDIQTVINNSVDPEFTNNVITSIRNSAGNKGRVTQSQEEEIETALNVVSQLDTILNLISGGNLDNDRSKELYGVKTGKVQGRISNLKAKFGGDPDAAALNAAITGLIPKVARGVFGEVGVLTDADIRRYRGTVPNMFLPENANEAVSIVLLDSLARSFGNKMQVLGKSRDVSGFEPIYLSMIEESAKLKNKIQGGGSTTQGFVTVINPQGQVGEIPVGQLQEALSEGFKQA